MASRLNPYLNFDGNAREAMEYYAGVFGGHLTISTFADLGAPADSADAARIMHAMLETEAGYSIMGSDITSEMEYHAPAGISVSISGDDTEALRGYWDKLSAAGTTMMPLAKQVWGDEFGMCTDQFGVTWLIDIVAVQP